MDRISELQDHWSTGLFTGYSRKVVLMLFVLRMAYVFVTFCPQVVFYLVLFINIIKPFRKRKIFVLFFLSTTNYGHSCLGRQCI